MEFPTTSVLIAPISLSLLPPPCSRLALERGRFQFPQFFDDYVVPDPQSLRPPPEATVSAEKKRMHQSQLGPGQHRKGFDKFLKPKNYTRDGFRSRKSGSGRKPSVHVDDFEKSSSGRRMQK